MVTSNIENIPKELEWEGKNMEAVSVLLNFLDQRLLPEEVSFDLSRIKKIKYTLTYIQIFFRNLKAN